MFMFHEVNIRKSLMLCCNSFKKIILNFLNVSWVSFEDLKNDGFKLFKWWHFFSLRLHFNVVLPFDIHTVVRTKKLSSLLSRKLKYVFKICNMMFSFQDWTFQTERNGRKTGTSFLTFHKDFWGFILICFKVRIMLFFSFLQYLNNIIQQDFLITLSCLCNSKSLDWAISH